MITFNNDKDLIHFIHNETVTTQEAADMLGCTRQYIKKLVDANKLLPVKVMSKDKLFLKKDIVERQLNKKK